MRLIHILELIFDWRWNIRITRDTRDTWMYGLLFQQRPTVLWCTLFRLFYRLCYWLCNKALAEAYLSGFVYSIKLLCLFKFITSDFFHLFYQISIADIAIVLAATIDIDSAGIQFTSSAGNWVAARPLREGRKLRVESRVALTFAVSVMLAVSKSNVRKIIESEEERKDTSIFHLVTRTPRLHLRHGLTSHPKERCHRPCIASFKMWVKLELAEVSFKLLSREVNAELLNPRGEPSVYYTEKLATPFFFFASLRLLRARARGSSF